MSNCSWEENKECTYSGPTIVMRITNAATTPIKMPCTIAYPGTRVRTPRTISYVWKFFPPTISTLVKQNKKKEREDRYALASISAEAAEIICRSTENQSSLATCTTAARAFQDKTYVPKLVSDTRECRPKRRRRHLSQLNRNLVHDLGMNAATGREQCVRRPMPLGLQTARRTHQQQGLRKNWEESRVGRMLLIQIMAQ